MLAALPHRLPPVKVEDAEGALRESQLQLRLLRVL